MRDTLLKISSFLIIFIISTGCANRVTATPYPEADLQKIQSVYVTKLPADKRGINEIIADKLRTLGYKVDTGTNSAPDADILVVYADKWMWDITMYMYELTVTIREPETNYPLASANSLHGSLTRKSPEAMVNEVINNLFNIKEK